MEPVAGIILCMPFSLAARGTMEPRALAIKIGSRLLQNCKLPCWYDWKMQLGGKTRQKRGKSW